MVMRLQKNKNYKRRSGGERENRLVEVKRLVEDMEVKRLEEDGGCLWSVEDDS